LRIDAAVAIHDLDGDVVDIRHIGIGWILKVRGGDERERAFRPPLRKARSRRGGVASVGGVVEVVP
jgi:hypothetical protein